MLRYQTLGLHGEASPDATHVTGPGGLALSGTRAREIWSSFGRVGILVISDLAALVTAAIAAYLLWIGPVLHQPPSLYLELAPLLALFPLIYLAAGLYPGFGLGAVETLRRLFNYTSVSFLALAAASFIARRGPLYSRMGFAISWILALALVPLFRFMVLSTVSGLRWWGESTAVVGSPEQAELSIDSVTAAFSLGYRVVGVLLVGQSTIRSVRNIPVLGGIERASHLAALGVATALVWDGPEVSATLSSLIRHFRHVVIIRDDKLMPVEQVRVRNLGGVLGFEFTNELLRKRNQVIKRALDVVVGAAGLILTAPVIALCGLLVKVISPGPMFFAQERGGLGGRSIRVWKLRTMHRDAERFLKEILAADPELERQWRQSMKLARDPRIIPVLGNFLRRFSIDELPQLWNLVKGEMSLVGPRPFPTYHLAMFSPEFLSLRSAVRPGLTGMWQVIVRSSGSIHDQETFDTYYIRNWSLWLDLYIIARTFFAVLAAGGAA